MQNIIVTGIFLLALLYVGKMFWKNTKSFSKKANCGGNCNCEK